MDCLLYPDIHWSYFNHNFFFISFYIRRSLTGFLKGPESMTDFLISSYPWIKSFHVISVISWMAGLLYLPRLFVYHVESGLDNSGVGDLFQVM